jgi:31-O-methyltransferase
MSTGRRNRAGRGPAALDGEETEYLYWEIFRERCYLRGGLRLDAGAIVVDAGANIGMSSLFFHWESPSAYVLAFEPAPGPYRALRSNFERHGIKGKAYECALSDADGRATLRYRPDASVLSSLHGLQDTAQLRRMLRNLGLPPERVERNLRAARRLVEVPCEVRTLSSVIAETGIDRIDYLKLDVEGSELAVLNGLGADEWRLVRQVGAEVHGDALLRGVVDLLRRHRFEVSVHQDEVFRGTEVRMVAATYASGAQ